MVIYLESVAAGVLYPVPHCDVVSLETEEREVWRYGVIFHS